MPSINYSVAANALGVNINQNVARSADGIDARAVALPVGIAGTLTTLTDNTHGVLTVAAIGAITTSTVVDVYWPGGRVYGCTVTATTSTTITFTSGTGPNLPIATTAVVVTPQVTLNLSYKAAALVFLAAEQTYASNLETASSHLDFQDSGSAELLSLDLAANTPYVADVVGGTANPFSGNPVAKLIASNGSATNAATLNLIVLQNSTT